MSSSTKTVKAVSLIIMASLIGRMLGFLREVVLAEKFGTGIEIEAYIISLGIPTVLFAGIGTAISTTFIPIFSEYLSKRNKEEAYDFANNMINFLAIFSMVISIIGIIGAPLIVQILSPPLKARGDIYILTIRLTQIMFPILIFTGVTYIASGMLQSLNRYTITALISIPYNLVVIIYLWVLNPYFGILGLSVATFVGWVLQFGIQIPFLYKERYRYKFVLDFKNEGVRKVFVLVIPVILGTTVQQINTLVDRALGAGLGGKAIPALNYANRLAFLSALLFVYGITTVIYPRLSSLSAQKNMAEFKKHITSAVNVIIFIIFPLTLGLILLRVPIIRIVFERGEFTKDDTLLTSIALLYYAIGLAGLGIREILDRAFYSLQDTRTPMINGIFIVIVNVILDIVLVRYMGLGGLALATSISFIMGVLILLYLLRQKIGPLQGRKMLIAFFKVTCATVVMGIIVSFAQNFLPLGIENVVSMNYVINCMVLIFIGVITYALASIVFQIEEAHFVWNILKEKLLKIKG